VSRRTRLDHEARGPDASAVSTPTKLSRRSVAALALARVRAELERRHPTYRFPVFLDIGSPAEWRRQAAGERVT